MANETTVWAVLGNTNDFGSLSVVETTVTRATNGIMSGHVDSFYDTKQEADERVLEIKRARDRAFS